LKGAKAMLSITFFCSITFFLKASLLGLNSFGEVSFSLKVFWSSQTAIISWAKFSSILAFFFFRAAQTSHLRARQRLLSELTLMTRGRFAPPYFHFLVSNSNLRDFTTSSKINNGF
jgi:hypothetical protein